MKLDDLKELYPKLNERMLNFFLNYSLKGTQVVDLTLMDLENSFHKINPNVIFNLPGIVQQPQSPRADEDLRVKLFAVREQVFLTSLATSYLMKLKEKYKSDGAKIKRLFEENCVKVLLDKASKAISKEEDKPRIITNFSNA